MVFALVQTVQCVCGSFELRKPRLFSSIKIHRYSRSFVGPNILNEEMKNGIISDG